MSIRGFVFDLDGTLVDSKIDFAAIRQELRLFDDDDILAHIDTLADSDRPRALESVFKYESAAARESTLIAGACEFVHKAMALGYPCAVFTRNARSIALDCIEMHELKIEMVIAREDAPAKPSPAGLITIAKTFGVDTKELLFVGDYIYDLQAGVAASVPTALYVPGEADFDTYGADFIFKTFSELEMRALRRPLNR